MSGEEDEKHEKNTEQKEEISGWADAMSKILGSNKPKKKKNLILSRAKKDYEVKRSTVEQETKFEVVSTDKNHEKNGEPDAQTKTKKNKSNVETKRKRTEDGEDEDQDISLRSRHKHELQNKRMRKEWENLNRSIPDLTKDRETERELMKIASKGVVELFNAVELQKKQLGRKLRNVDKSEFKRDKVLAETKDLFEDALEKVSKKKR